MSKKGNGDILRFAGKFPETGPEQAEQVAREVKRINNRLQPVTGGGLYGKSETSLGKLEVFKFEEGIRFTQGLLVVHDDPEQINYEVFWVESDRVAETNVRKRGPGLPGDAEAEQEQILKLLGDEPDWNYHDAETAKEVADYFDALLLPK